MSDRKTHDAPTGTKLTARINHALLSDLVASTGKSLRVLSLDIERQTGVSVSPSTLSRLTVGNEDGVSPSADTLLAIAGYFGFHVGNLFTPAYQVADLEGTIASADDLDAPDKAALLHFYRRLRKA